MPTVIEVPANLIAPEHRLAFKPASPSWDHAVVSGEVDFVNSAPLSVEGETDDDLTEYEIHMVVGPWWRDVQVCVPSVTIAGHLNTNSDEDDQQMWIVRDLKWTTDGEGAPNPGEVRIRLEFKVGLQGEHSWLRQLSYYFTAAGRQLGLGGITKPGPIKTGP
jgi:hypothetical protein